MKKVSVSEIDTVPNPLNVHEIRKPISAMLGTTDFALNYFELETGESFSGGLHTHHDQEEVFYVMDGTATFEVGRDGETVTVGPEEAIRFAPGEFQCGHNRDEKTVVVLALGAPGEMHNWDDLESIVYCPECNQETSHSVALENGQFAISCNDCGDEH